MSRERARARAARDAERAAERERRERLRARRQRLERLRPELPSLPRRRRRYGALPVRVTLGLAFGWVLTQWVLWQLFGDLRTRLGLALLTLLALPLLVVLVPMRGRR